MLAKPWIKCKHVDRGQVPLRAARYLLLHFTGEFIYEGQPDFFVFPNPEVPVLNYPHINTPAAQKEA